MLGAWAREGFDDEEDDDDEEEDDEGDQHHDTIHSVLESTMNHDDEEGNDDEGDDEEEEDDDDDMDDEDSNPPALATPAAMVREKKPPIEMNDEDDEEAMGEHATTQSRKESQPLATKELGTPKIVIKKRPKAASGLMNARLPSTKASHVTNNSDNKKSATTTVRRRANATGSRRLPKQKKLKPSDYNDTVKTSGLPSFPLPPQTTNYDNLPLPYAFLRGQAWHKTQSDLSVTAQTLLQTLLEEEEFLTIPEEKEDDPQEAHMMAQAVRWVAHKQEQIQNTWRPTVVNAVRPESQPNNTDANKSEPLTDAEIVEWTKKRPSQRTSRPLEQLAYLQSFLAVFEQEEGTKSSTKSGGATGSANSGTGVAARLLLKRCCLAVCPSMVPSALDAEEMAMAALEFLSSTFHSNQDQEDVTALLSPSLLFPSLPLIRPIKVENTIKKRVYVRAYDWSLRDPTFVQSMNALEEVFFNDASSYKWLRRGVFVPPILDDNDGSKATDNKTIGTKKKNASNLNLVFSAEERDQLLRKGKHKLLISTAPKKKPSQSSSPAATLKAPLGRVKKSPGVSNTPTTLSAGPHHTESSLNPPSSTTTPSMIQRTNASLSTEHETEAMEQESPAQVPASSTSGGSLLWSNTTPSPGIPHDDEEEEDDDDDDDDEED